MMRPISGFIVAAVLVLGLLSFAVVSIDRSSIDSVSIVGDLTPEQLSDLRRNLEGVDLSAADAAALQAHVQDLAWVHHVNVRRGWPSGLDLEVFTEQAIAYWNDDAFINEQGRVLFTNLLPVGDLPHLYGPAGAELEVMKQYQQLSLMLSSHQHEMNVLSLTERGSWSIETEAGIQVLLGKEDLKARTQRFLTVATRLQAEDSAAVIKRMDARYINGVAVDFAEDTRVELAELNNTEANNSVGERSL